MNKVPCPACGEQNYENAVVCWACGAPMRATVGAAVPPPSSSPEPTVPGAQPPDPSPQPPIPGDRRPAEIEAASLTEKPYVTPPVDEGELPKTPGEWLAYAGAWVHDTFTAVRDSLEEYDRRRGHPSGMFSSASCLATALAFFLVAAVVTWLLPVFLGR